MAFKAETDADNRFTIVDEQNRPIFSILAVGSGLTTAFCCLAFSEGSETIYLWPNTSGVFRYGTTQPTVSTQNSAGSAV